MTIDKQYLIDPARQQAFITARTEEGSCDMPQGNERDESQYTDFLGIDFELLRGKNVLNIGAGRTGLAEKEMCNHGANVVTLSPIFANNGPAGQAVRLEF